MDGLSSLDSSLDLALIFSSLEESAREEVSDELLSLSAIYDDAEDGTPALSLYRPTSSSMPPAAARSDSKAPLRLVLSTSLPSSPSIPLSILLTIPPGYPISEPPLLQLQSLYLSSFAVTDALFGEVLRTFMHDPSAGLEAGVEWTEGGVSLYEGIEWVRQRCETWVAEREKEGEKGEERRAASRPPAVYEIPVRGEDEPWEEEAYEEVDVREVPAWKKAKAEGSPQVKCPVIVSSQPLLDRKSVFVGHVATVHSIDEVHLVLDTLLSDKKIAKATHNISAFRFTTPTGSLNQDNDDDGESAAGSRLAHLLSLLDVENVMVVVTRWYGGIHLGADRFKDINSVARDALQAGGYLDEAEKGKGKKGGAKRK